MNATSPTSDAPATGAAALPAPPRAEQRPHSFERHGVRVDDPWHWLKDQSYPTIDDEDVLSYLRAENAYFETAMAPHQPLIDTLFQEMRGRIPEDDSSVPVRDGEWLYWWAFQPGAQYRSWYRRPVAGGDQQPIYDEPAEVVVSALLDGMDRWVREGRPMPKAARVARKGRGVVRDAGSGNMTGGVRPPWIAAPSAAYLTDFETRCGLVYDTKIPFTAARLRRLYGDYATYRRRFEAAKAAAIRDGYLLPEDAARVHPVAKPSDF